MTKKILIVENEARVAEALDRRFRSRGYVPTVVDGKDAALAAFDEHRPDLVVISLTLEGEQGEDVCRAVRGLPLGALVPILLMGTGQESVSGVTDSIAIGADHYFNKPNALGELMAKVVTYIGPGAGLDLNLDEPEDALMPAGHNRSQVLGEWSELDGLLRPNTTPSEKTENQSQASTVGTDADTSNVPDHRFGLPPVEDLVSIGSPEQSEPAAEQLPPVGTDVGRVRLSPPESPGDSKSNVGRLKPGQPVPLEERGVEFVLHEAADSRLTGRVEIASGGVLRRIFLEAGRVVYTDSSSTGEDLSAYLAAEGFVTASALSQARVKAGQVGVSPEEVLIEAGLLSPDDVHDALRGHILQRTFDFFSIERGEAVVVRGGPRPIDPVDLGYSPKRIILDGIRRKFGRLRLYRVFGTGTTVPRRSVDVAAKDWTLRADENAILGACDGRRSVLEIARKTQQGEVDVLAILYGFSILGLVVNPHAQLPGGVGMLPAVVGERALAPQTMDEMPGYAELVQQKYSAVREANYFYILGVERGATGSEIRTAYEENRRRFDPHRVRKTSPLWRQVDEIHSIVQDAYDLLSNERLRERYEAALS